MLVLIKEKQTEGKTKQKKVEEGEKIYLQG